MILCLLELLSVVIIVFFAFHFCSVIGNSLFSWPVIGCLLVLSLNRIVNDILEMKSFILFHVSWQSLIKQFQTLGKVARSEYESLTMCFCPLVMRTRTCWEFS